MPLAAAVGTSAGAQMGMTPEQQPWWFNAWGNQPGLTPSLGLGSYRGANTMMYGGWGSAADTTMMKNMPWRPRNFGRLSHVNAFRAEGGYSPYQGAGIVNSIGKFASNRSPRFAGYMAKLTGEYGPVFGSTVAKTPFMTPGLGSQVVSAARLRGMGGAEIPSKMIYNLNQASLTLGGAGDFTTGMVGRDASAAFLAEGGIANQAIGGVIHGMHEGMGGMQFAEDIGRPVFRKAASFTAKHLATHAGIDLTKVGLRTGIGKVGLSTAMREVAGVGGRKAAVGLAAKWGIRYAGALATGPVAPFVAAAMTAWMAYDVAKLGATLGRDLIVKPAVRLAKDAVKSFQGGIQKPVMGMGFRDSEVAMTSRSRGVAAIQNSRLNARSILGNEGGAMAAHFG